MEEAGRQEESDAHKDALKRNRDGPETSPQIKWADTEGSHRSISMLPGWRICKISLWNLRFRNFPSSLHDYLKLLTVVLKM